MRGRVLKKHERIAECGARVSKFRENNSSTNSRNLLFVIPSLSPPLSDAKQNCRSIHMVTTLKKVSWVYFGVCVLTFFQATHKKLGQKKCGLDERKHARRKNSKKDHAAITQHQSYKKRAQNTPPKRFKPKLHKHNPPQPHLSPTH